MKHFSMEKWADFARDVVGEDERAAMKSHLARGCKECGGMLATWKHVHDLAKRESSFRPPEAAVRTVKAAGMLQIDARQPSPVQLLFDSAQTPALAGVRSAGTLARQLLYGVGNYRLDLRMEPQMDSDKVAIVGQILNSADPSQQAGSFPVSLLQGRKKLAASHTNSHGEFHFECDLEGRLQLELKLPHGGPVRIPLIEPLPPEGDVHLESIDSERDRGKGAVHSKSTRKRV